MLQKYRIVAIGVSLRESRSLHSESILPPEAGRMLAPSSLLAAYTTHYFNTCGGKLPFNMEPSLSGLVTAEELKWIFVGGKGGVGKTTTSCCLGIQLARRRKNVLIVSTDPAHNLSDAFNQKFSRKPTLVEGFANLYCMEIDPSTELEEAGEGSEPGAPTATGIASLIKDFAGALPGVDEAMSFMELMKRTECASLQTMEFDVTVFDTAPTGHTLRLLALPGMLDKAIAKILTLRDSMGGLLGPLQAMMGGGGETGLNQEALFAQLDNLKRSVDRVQARLRNPDETTFLCVCIPEFLSLYETERLVQELTKFDIDTHNIVVNQVLFVADGSECTRCTARKRMQQKYLDQIADLYEDFHVVRTPLLDEEVRGTAKLRAFGEYLISQYTLGQEIPEALQSQTTGGSGAGTM